MKPNKQMNLLETLSEIETKATQANYDGPSMKMKPKKVLALVAALREAVEALGESAKLIHFFPPTHIFQDASDAHELQKRAIEVFDSHKTALASINAIFEKEGK